MANYAIIENGIVVNAIVADADFAAEIGAVELPDGYGIGDFYDGENWTKQPEPESEPAPPEIPIDAQITDLQMAVIDLYEMILGGE